MDVPRKKYFISYLPDWIALILFGVIGAAFTFLKPFDREFSINDKSIQHQFKSDSVPFWLAVVICYIVPVIAIVIICLFVKRSFYNMHIGILAITLAQVITLTFTNIIKNMVGRHRPDFIARCKPDLSKINMASAFSIPSNTTILSDPTLSFFTNTICTNQDKNVLHDGMRSFPSGHSSASFCGLFFFSLYLAGALSLYDRKGYAAKAIIFVIPLLVASVIAVSRTSDYRHHWQDVTVGGLLGMVVAYFVYYVYYPKLSSSNCNSPYYQRFSDTEYRSHDEEEEFADFNSNSRQN
ncbi:hypothetical protein BB559_004215 [Furculomyces boomerangus]|uniref:Phosphatidic acid phosphatase type 2/haloperoxidase domain-containing protein n=1 Tax=Furculomyces boomerangus TaxID=61424 RepID=A0A2T9Y9Y8_9FUNG|nr:hypothetical protein BB559_006425 [Furculomyces boomerangus]PVU89153.1 hypothetical protein BB559_005220 [Furculomyces boomerangus]PVU91232.1 hypothetical protein BB559_004215 [Furculomyces boomerangus]